MRVGIEAGWRKPLSFLLLVFLFLWPAVVNRQPFFFPDTSTYIRGFDMAMQRTFHITSEWDKKATKLPPLRAAPSEVARQAGQHAHATRISSFRSDAVVLAGRSIYYGFLGYVSYAIWQFWPLALLQAILLTTAILATFQHLSGRDRWLDARSIGGTAFLALVTPAAFFADMALPDIFCSFAIMAAAVLLFAAEPYRWRPLSAWTALLTVSLLCHTANVLLMGAVLALALLAAIFPATRPRRQGILALFAALVLSQLGEAGFSRAVHYATGHDPVRPPFLTARLIDDGPGSDFVRRTCPANGFVVCRYADRLPLPSDGFLWDKSGGVFQAADAADQRLLGAQDGSFALAALRERPTAVLASTASSVGRQFLSDDMGDFNYSAAERSGFIRNFPQRIVRAMEHSRAYRQEMPTGLAKVTALPLALASLLLTGWWLLRFGRQNPIAARSAMTIVAAVMLNTIVCGAFSTPHGRYQMRVVWLLPMVAIGLLSRSGSRSGLPANAR